MTKEELFNKALPKWPGLIVVGEPVTKEQAMEIIIRTQGSSFSTNEHEFECKLYEALFDIKIEKAGWNGCDKQIRKDLGYPPEISYENPVPEKTLEYYEGFGAVRDWKAERLAKYKIIDELYYLHNSQIVSCWIGGTKGWCNWDGTIKTSNYNIGKWPSIEEVYDEWVIIAKEFPFLNLKCQLLSAEACEEDTDRPAVSVVQFNIEDGLVEILEPEPQLIPCEEISFDFTTRSEIGCTLEQYKEALKVTEESVKNKQE